MGNVGLEYSWSDMAFIRSGLNINHDTASLAIGAGLKWNISTIAFNFDYAFVDYGDLKYTHQFGYNFKF